MSKNSMKMGRTPDWQRFVTHKLSSIACYFLDGEKGQKWIVGYDSGGSGSVTGSLKLVIAASGDM
jgi:hypothetical protein